MGALAEYNKKLRGDVDVSPHPHSSLANDTNTNDDKVYVRPFTLSDGSIIELDGNELTELDQKSYKYIPFKTGKGYDQKYSRINISHSVPALIYPEPEYLVKAKNFLSASEDEEKLNEKQKAYKDLVFTQEDLDKKTPRKVKNSNNQGLDRYIFISLLKACKNGFLYYSIPLIINVIFLIFNFTKFNFFANITITLFVLLNFLLILKTFKEYSNFFIRLGIISLILAVDVLLIIMGKRIPNFYNLIYIPYTIKLFLIASCLYYFGGYYIGFLKAYNDEVKVDNGNVVTVFSGPPRVGKTSSGVEEAFVESKIKWEKLKVDYYFYKSRENSILKSKNNLEKLKLKELQLSYSFYIMSRCIPCLWSNIGIFDKSGRPCHKVTINHMKGLDRLPVYSTVFFDEIGAAIRADAGLSSSGVKPLDISDMFRLGGQWIRWSVYCSEQDYNHIFIDVRRVAGQNILISGRQWACKPNLLYGFYKFLYWLKSDRLESSIKSQPLRAGFLYKLGKFVNSIGFAVTDRTYRCNTQTSGDLVEKDNDGNLIHIGPKRKRWQPIYGICNYDHEAYKQLYPSYFDKKIVGELFTSMQIEASDEHSYDFVNSTDGLIEKRKGQKGMIKKLSKKIDEICA